MDRRAFLGLGVGILGVAAAPAWLRPAERLVSLSVPVMGTVAELAVPARTEAAARSALAAAARELTRIEALMTRFRADSDVGRFNGAAPDERVVVAPETAEVVRSGLDWARASGGVFDPTLGHLTRVWDPAYRRTPPSSDELAAAGDTAGVQEGGAGAPGWTEMEVDGAGRLRRSGRHALDLGAIAKGYGVDRAGQVLRDHGVFRGLVNVGGDLLALGDGPGGRPWRIGVRDPANPAGVVATLEVVDGAVATSGDYLRFFEHQGRRYHHILDPRTGEPATGPVRSVTVRGESVMEADAASTVAFTLGPTAAEPLLARRRAGRVVHHS